MLLLRIIFYIFIFWCVLAAIGWFAKFMLKRKLRSWMKNAQEQATSTSDEPNVQEGELVKCFECGLYIAKKTAIFKDENAYCSEQHAKINN